VSFKSTFEKMKQTYTDDSVPDVVRESDLEHLPLTIQRYVRRSGAVGRQRTNTFDVTFTGEMKVRADGPWIPIKAWQFTNIAQRVRLFYIESSMFGIPLRGLHVYISGNATMKIKLGGLITVANASGPIMDRSETVTYFNDMCLIAPETLIDPMIRWHENSEGTVDATMTVNGITIQARLYVDSEGDLVNFTSNDRSMSSDGKNHVKARWSTPCSRYTDHNGRRLISYGEASWDLPSGSMSYARFNITRF
jgi:hypothetical protein